MDITVYTTSTCPYSRQLKQYLAGKKVEYAEVVLDKTPAKLTEMRQYAQGFSGVPFVLIKQERDQVETVKGFDSGKLETIFAQYAI